MMTKLELTPLLELRAKTSLHNPGDVTDELVSRALDETLELIADSFTSAEAIDIAFVRLCLLLKIEPSEFELAWYKELLAKAQKEKSLSLSDNDGEPQGLFIVGQRTSGWDDSGLA